MTKCSMHVDYVFLNVRFFLQFDAIAVFEARKKSHRQGILKKGMFPWSINLWRVTAVGEYERVTVFSLEVTLERVC